MLYMSNDRNGIFETEQECLEYEQRIEQERVRKRNWRWNVKIDWIL